MAAMCRTIGICLISMAPCFCCLNVTESYLIVQNNLPYRWLPYNPSTKEKGTAKICLTAPRPLTNTCDITRILASVISALPAEWWWLEAFFFCLFTSSPIHRTCGVSAVTKPRGLCPFRVTCNKGDALFAAEAAGVCSGPCLRARAAPNGSLTRTTLFA